MIGLNNLSDEALLTFSKHSPAVTELYLNENLLTAPTAV